jgi:NAD(P)-dependent dehydrogenase (short-subunit alcohol dehydrogenase family)
MGHVGISHYEIVPVTHWYFGALIDGRTRQPTNEPRSEKPTEGRGIDIKVDGGMTVWRSHKGGKMTSVNNRIALVIGGSRGLGRSTALAVAQRGVDVIVTYRTLKSSALEVVHEIERQGRKAAALQLDAADLSAFPVFISSFRETLATLRARNTIDFLVNNAGFGLTAPFVDTTEEMFDRLMNVHLKGVFFLTQAVLPLLAAGGRVVNLSSGLSRFSFPGYAAYAVMKGGIDVLTRYLAKELGPRGITVNAVAPGAIETDFGGGVVRDNAGLNKMIAAQTALGRVGLPEDIGPLIAAWLSESGGWVNGQRIEVSGGMLL